MERPRPVLKLTGPLDVRSTSLAALAILSFIYFLRTAQAVFIPVALAVVTACALAPLVSWLRQRARIPKPLGAAAILLLLCGLLGLGINSLQPQIMRILDVVPQATAKFSQAMRESARNNNGALQKIMCCGSRCGRGPGPLAVGYWFNVECRDTLLMPIGRSALFLYLVNLL